MSFATCIDITGQTFGRWFVISRAETNKCGQAMFLCRCLCGTERTIVGNTLRKGKSTSCGCYPRKSYVALAPGEAQLNRLLYSYKQSAKKRNLVFELSLEEFKNITKQNCHYCGSIGTPFAENCNKKSNGLYIGNGIDRKDNSLGYILENCLPCCTWCNQMKLNKTYEEFVTQIRTICEHLGD